MKSSRFLNVLLAGAFALGCAPEFDRQSVVRGFRVFAVQKDKPYAAPGEDVTLTMLDHDTEGRSIQRVWLSGCENPPADLYAGCFLAFAEGGNPFEPGGEGGFSTGTGSTFTFRVSEDIISSRPPPADPDFPPYGIAYVFFAACAGELRPAPTGEGEVFPLACYSGDTRVGPEGFVAGYTTLFAYDTFRNQNPFITGFEVEGRPIEPDCIGTACIDPEVGSGGLDGGPGGDAGTDAAAMPEPALDETCSFSAPGCVEICQERDIEDCPGIAIKPIIDPASAERDEVLSVAGQGTVLEQMWVNYYVDRGSVASEVRLLNDAVQGWNDEFGTEFRAPRNEGPVRVWAVAHDNRGGVEWARVTLGVRAR